MATGPLALSLGKRGRERSLEGFWQFAGVSLGSGGPPYPRREIELGAMPFTLGAPAFSGPAWNHHQPTRDNLCDSLLDFLTRTL